MRPLALLLLALALSVLCAGDASAKNIVKAYFNGQEATVTGVTLKTGEPFTVDLYVTPDRPTTVAALLREPGGDWDAYAPVSGDPAGTVVRKKGSSSDTVHFRWVLAPREAWAGGSAPLNVVYDVWGEDVDGDVQGYFTVVEAYISPERFQPPRQAGVSPFSTAFSTAAALALAARHRLPRIAKPLNPKQML